MLSVLCSLGLAVLMPVVAIRYGNLANGLVGYLAVLPLVFGFLLFAIRLLRRREALLFIVMAAVCGGVAGTGLANQWVNRLTAKAAFAERSETRRVADEFPARLSVPPAEKVDARTGDPPPVNILLEGLKRGDNAFGVSWRGDAVPRPAGETGDPRRTLPLQPLLAPLLWTGLLVALSLAMVYALIACVSRQWAQHERLQHPIAQLQEGITDRAVLRNRGFCIAVGSVLLFWIWNLSQHWGWNPLPPIISTIEFKQAWKLIGLDAPPSKEFVFDQWSKIQIRPMVIGIAFLLLFSIGGREFEMGEGLSPEVAAAVEFFLSASEFVTGQILAVDGGLSLR